MKYYCILIDRIQRVSLNNIPWKDDISAFDEYDLFDWKVLEIKTNIEEIII